MNDLRQRNTGLCGFRAMTFGGLIQHFISGGEETCFMACAYGTLKVIGSAGRKKHEKKTQGSQILVTLYMTGLVPGDTVLPVFLITGNKW